MATEIYFDGFEVEEVGGSKTPPGDYHTQIVDVKPDGGRNGQMVVTFEIVGGTNPAAIGRHHVENFPTDVKSWAQKKKAAVAFASGIVTIEQAKEAKAKGEPLAPQWENMVGKQVCISIGESKDGRFANINFDNIWSPTDRRAVHIPLNAGMLAAGGIVLPADRPVGGIPKDAKAAAKTKNADKPAAAPPPVDNLLSGVV